MAKKHVSSQFNIFAVLSFFFTFQQNVFKGRLLPSLLLIFSDRKLLSPFYYKTGTMGWISSTCYVLPIRLSYRMLNRVIRVHRLNFKCDFIKQFTSLCYPGHNNLDDLWLAQANDLSRINTHGLQHKENCIQRNVLLDAIFTKSTTYNFCSFS